MPGIRACTRGSARSFLADYRTDGGVWLVTAHTGMRKFFDVRSLLVQNPLAR
jgi:hypothetical protein